MALTFRTTDLGKWGVGKGSNLTADEFDENTWDHKERIDDLETAPPPAAINGATIVDDQLTFTKSDATTIGPITLPVYVPQHRGPWAAATNYLRGELFTFNSAVYSVQVPHTSELTFDPGETSTDGDYYAVFFDLPDATLPTGGAQFAVLMKVGTDDFDIAWVEAAPPRAGGTGQVLRKLSTFDYDFSWDNNDLETMGDVDITAPQTGDVLQYSGDTDGGWYNAPYTTSADNVSFTPLYTDFVATNVQDAIEEVQNSFPDLSNAARLDVEDQVLTGGTRVTSKSLGTVTTGTLTPDPGDRPIQHYTNGGAHTLAPGANGGSYFLDITNNASAGAITTSGWTKVSGDSFTTTNTHKFRISCSIGNAGSLLNVQAMQ